MSALPFRIWLMVIASCVGCSNSSVAPKKLARTGNAAQPTDAAICHSDADCVFNPVDCSECGRCPGEEPCAVLRTKVDSLRADCARHLPVRLNPRAGVVGLVAPACSPCSGGVDGPRPIWQAICRGGACAVEQTGTEQPFRNGELTQPSSQSSPPHKRPPLDASCASDADCVLVGLEIEDDLPRTHACCPACTERAANRDWLARFRATCEAAPPPMCPPLGCPMPILRAVCQRGHCAAIH